MISAFVGIVGRPNVGKSSLLNCILNYELAITTAVPQTTRNQIKGIYNDFESQIIFIDTPGIHKPKQEMGNFLNQSALGVLKDVDLLLFLTPLDEKIGPGDKLIITNLMKVKAPKVALISKIDLKTPLDAQKKATSLKKLGFEEVIGFSTKIRASQDHLISYLKTVLPTGKPYYDINDLTDLSTRFLVKEIIREAAIELTHDEIPHALGVEIIDFVETENKVVISANIFVEKLSQKQILIGQKGKMIKNIGISARQKIKKRLNLNNDLYLKIKVAKNWTKKVQFIKKFL